jgi:ferritin
MLKENLIRALNDQVNAEYYSAYLYLAMSAYAERKGFKGAANWLFEQAREEMSHGLKIYRHLLERGASPVFAAVQAPPASFAGLQDVFEKVLSHERRVTEQINELAAAALRENDHATYEFILWYVKEQVEEEAGAEELLTKVSRVSGHPGLLYSLDKELAERKFSEEED